MSERRLPVHVNAVRRDIDVQERIWKKEGLRIKASSSPYVEKSYPPTNPAEK